MTRSSAIDFFKAVAMFLIVIIHTQPFLYYPADDPVWQEIGYGFNIVARVAVPFFFMVTGYIVAQKSKDRKAQISYAKRFAIRLLKIYVIWLVLYFLFDFVSVYLKGQDGFEGSFKDVASHYGLPTLFYYGYDHLWFLTALVYALVALVFALYIQRPYLLFAGSIFLFLLGLFGQSYSVFFASPVETRDGLFLGTLFVSAGYILGTVGAAPLKPISFKILFGLAVFFALLQIAEGWVLRSYFQAKLGDFYFSTFFASSFLLLSAMKRPDFMQNNRLSSLGHYTLGIYLLHPAIIRVFNSFSFFESVKNTFIGQLAFPCLVFALSCGLSWLYIRYKRPLK